jgi:hypothetical protein
MLNILEGLTVILTSIWWLQKLRWRLSVSKQAAQKFEMQRFDLRKLNSAEVKEQYQVKI